MDSTPPRIKSNRLVEGSNGVQVAQLVVDHKGQHTHLGGTALVELDGTLGELGLFIKGVPAEVQGSVAEVTNEFSASDVLHDGEFQEANKGQNLEGTGNRDGEGSIPARSEVGELGAGVVNVSGKVDACDKREERKLATTVIRLRPHDAFRTTYRPC